MSSMSKYNLQTVPVATAARLAAKPVKLMAFLLFGGSGATSVEFKNAATDTGTVLLSANVAIANTLFIDLSTYGGVTFDVGCFVKPAGAGAICYCWYE
jgi:hypothetical protein